MCLIIKRNYWRIADKPIKVYVVRKVDKDYNTILSPYTDYRWEIDQIEQTVLHNYSLGYLHDIARKTNDTGIIRKEYEVSMGFFHSFKYLKDAKDFQRLKEKLWEWNGTIFEAEIPIEAKYIYGEVNIGINVAKKGINEENAKGYASTQLVLRKVIKWK